MKSLALAAALLAITTTAHAMTRTQALERCSGVALAALPPPSPIYADSRLGLDGAIIGDSLGRAAILLSVRASCMRKLGFGKKPEKVHQRPAGGAWRER